MRRNKRGFYSLLHGLFLHFDFISAYKSKNAVFGQEIFLGGFGFDIRRTRVFADTYYLVRKVSRRVFYFKSRVDTRNNGNFLHFMGSDNFKPFIADFKFFPLPAVRFIKRLVRNNFGFGGVRLGYGFPENFNRSVLYFARAVLRPYKRRGEKKENFSFFSRNYYYILRYIFIILLIFVYNSVRI